MIDIHTHILPGMDDGSKSPQESVEMLRLQVQQGVTEVVLTPHFYAHQNGPEEFLRRRDRAWEWLKASLPAGMPGLHFGAEVQYFEGICQVEDLNRLCFDGRTTLLLEMPFHPWSTRAIQDVLELAARPDLQIILAHIERYYFNFAPRDVWPAFREAGIHNQSNADFFLNWKTRHQALRMYEQGMIEVVASDCHNLTSRRPNLGQAMTYVRRVSRKR